jgi:hypothetical protein
MKKRPIGFSILAIFLWWLTLAGVANAVLPLGRMHPAWAVAYAVSAFIAALGLWKVRARAFHAFLTWSAVVIFIMLQYGSFQIPLLKLAIFACFILILLSSGAVYIKRTLRKTVEQPHQPDAD